MTMKQKNMKQAFWMALMALMLFPAAPKAQDMYRESILQYIETYAPVAIREMNRTGFPASIKIAQGIHESGAGKSHLVQKSNNHFGLKCKSSWTGGKVYHDDDERGECFRQYGDAEESYEDHSNYMKAQERYASLFDLDPDDYESWAWGLKKAGYATSPVYAQTLIKYIETYQLNLLNQYVSGEEEDEEEVDLSTYFAALNEPRPQSSPNARTRAVTGPSVDEDELEKVSKPVIVTTNNKSTSTSKTSATESRTTKTKKTNYGSTFKINGIKVIEAEKGSSLLSLAKQHRIQLSTLLSYNDLTSGTPTLKEDQLIYLQRKKKTGKTKYHKVKKGETLHEISQLEGIRLSSLMQLNKLKKGMEPKVGQQLNLKEPADTTGIGQTFCALSRKGRPASGSCEDCSRNQP
jgi:LysM repeat protein